MFRLGFLLVVIILLTKIIHSSDPLGHISGPKIVTDYSVTYDGNFNLKLNIKGTTCLYLSNVEIGKCNLLSPGIAIQNNDSNDITILIDLDSCLAENDLQGSVANSQQYIQDIIDYKFNGRPPSDSLSQTLEVNSDSAVSLLNQPILVCFTVMSGPNKEIPSEYILTDIKTNFFEDYIVQLDADTCFTSLQGVAADENDNPIMTNVNQGLYFSYKTYEDESFKNLKRRRLL